jgi:putative ABC transport system substrate-binding protein
MTELGWTEGQTFTMESRFTERDDQKLRSAAADLVRLPVDVIVAVSSPAVNAASAATVTIPIIAIDLETDPVAKCFAASLARPSKNITGLFLDLPELNGKRLQLLKELVPTLSRVAVLWDPSLDPTPLKAAELAARTVSVDLQVASAGRREEFAQALGEATRQHAGALLVVQSPAFDLYAKDIADLALKYRLPSIGLFNEFAKSGGLASYGPDLRALFAERKLRRSNLEGRPSWKSSDPATSPIRACRQREDSEGSWPHDPAVHPCQSRRDHPMSEE